MTRIRILAVLILFSTLSASNGLFADPGDSFTLASADGVELTLPDEQQGVGVRTARP